VVVQVVTNVYFARGGFRRIIIAGLARSHAGTGHTIAALAWCAGIGITGYPWAVATFRKRA
jgi:hypothetical protein